MSRSYHPSTLTRVPSKGDRFYVFVTTPDQLRGVFGKQRKKSTGTTDEKIARERQHELTDQIYKEFDAKLTTHKHAEAITIIEDFCRLMNIRAPRIDWEESHVAAFELARVRNAASNVLFNSEDFSEAVEFAAVRCVGEEVEDLEEDVSKGTMFTDRKVSAVFPKYLDGRPWNRLSTKGEAERYIKQFIQLVGDLNVDDVNKKHAFDFARELHEQGKSNAAVKAANSYVKNLFSWGVENGLLAANPWEGAISLKNYGYKKTPYRPFSKQQLFALFQQQMPEQDRIVFEILITTGMRLDEAALLTWDNVKLDDAVPHFDLRDAIVKTQGSERFVPIPSVIQHRFEGGGTGRLFTYRLDKDGKAQHHASRCLNRYIHAIRDHRKQVTHSLRGTLKDLLRDEAVPKEIHDFITGHASGDQAGKYGVGPSLAVRYEALNRVQHPWLG